MRTFGLIGYPLTHSFSQKYFTEKFRSSGIEDAQYLNFPLESIESFPALIKEQATLNGLNVTIPYKEQVIPFLDELDESVQQIGACNCILVKNGQLKGYNTDYLGFKVSLMKKLKPYHTHALVLGEGGAAKAVNYALKKLGIEFLTVSRRGKDVPGVVQYNQLNDEMLEQFTLIVNTTPLGMSPNIETAPDIPYNALTSRHYLYDLVYNPSRTLFLQLGEERGATIENGMEMLTIQAEEGWKIWNA
jgi:shikimate dehydrogenase